MTLVRDGVATVDRAEEVARPRIRSVERLRLVTIMAAITLAVFAQATGNTAADTKLDLVVSPFRFLGRATQLWDPIGAAGQLQNQAYGYLFPIGPFFALFHGLGMPAWIIQRAFESVILCAAFFGTYRLSRRLGVDRFWPAVAAGLVYALAPRMLSELTSISAELMPPAALPWVLLPLVAAGDHGSPRRAAARSGVALMFAGGVNAAATLAILPMPVLWLATRAAGPQRRALTLWWSGVVALACAWWAIPLLALGKYSPPFLDWIETSSTTTAPTSLIATLRGADQWIAYLGPGVWPAGWILASVAAVVLATSLVAGGGLMGLSLRGVANRNFLWATLLLGLVLVTFGHASTVGPPFAAAQRDLLDGLLVPFRNVHKFDPLIRMPLALGVGFLLCRASRMPQTLRLPRLGMTLPIRTLATIAAISAGAVAAAPVWTNHLVSSQRITAEPGWWVQAGKWLGGNAHGARALVVPASGSPQYLWGGTVDQALQPVALSPWTVRDGVPLTQAGYVRLLDAIHSMLASGTKDERLTAMLHRAGIGFVVIANDLNASASNATPTMYVRASLDNLPGARLRASFGPLLGGPLGESTVFDGGGTVARPAVQIFSIGGRVHRANLMPVAGAIAATGSSDALTQLVGRGLRGDRAVLFGRDAAGVGAPTTVTTDGIRRREVSFASLSTVSGTMTSEQLYSQQRKVHDYLPPDAGPLSVYRYRGFADVSASSSGADNWAFINRGLLNGPWSALDSDPSSAWQSTGVTGLGQWLQLTLTEPNPSKVVRVSFSQPDAKLFSLPTRVTVTTDRGSRSQSVVPVPGAQPLRLPKGPWRMLRITVDRFDDPARAGSVAISSVQVPGLQPRRLLDVPSIADPDVFAFDAATGQRPACRPLSVGVVCDPAAAIRGQEDSGIDRAFTTERARAYQVSASVRFRSGPSLNRLLDRTNPVSVTASSTGSQDPRLRPGAAVDGNRATIWQAERGDVTPTLRLDFPTPRTVNGVQIIGPGPGTPVALPLRVTVRAGGSETTSDLDARGRVEFTTPVTTRSIRITIDKAALRSSTSTVTGITSLVAPGISEVTLLGAPDAPPSPPRISLPCGQGPTVVIDGQSVPLSVSGDRTDLLDGLPVPARACTQIPVQLGVGQHTAQLDATERTEPASLTLKRGETDLAGPVASSGTSRVRSWGATQRTVRIDATARSLFVVHENFNPGWQASYKGTALRPIRVDGWEQAFVVPAGTHGIVEITYGPQRLFLAGLIAGLLAALAVVALACWPQRRPDRRAGVREGSLPRIVLALGVGVATTLLVGWAGPAIVMAMVVLGLVLRDRAAAVLTWAAGLLMLGAALVQVNGPSLLTFVRQDLPSVQVLCIGAVSAGLVASAAGVRSRRGT